MGTTLASSRAGGRSHRSPTVSPPATPHGTYCKSTGSCDSAHRCQGSLSSNYSQDPATKTTSPDWSTVPMNSSATTCRTMVTTTMYCRSRTSRRNTSWMGCTWTVVDLTCLWTSLLPGAYSHCHTLRALFRAHPLFQRDNFSCCCAYITSHHTHHT